MRSEMVTLFNLNISNLSKAEVLEKIEGFIKSGRPQLIVTLNVFALVSAQKDKELKDIINSADLSLPDGKGLILAAKLLNLPLKERISGVDLVEELSELAAKKGYSIYLFGAKRGVAEKAAKRLQSSYSGLKVGGAEDGYFTPQDEPKIIERIKKAKVDILLVALGIPRQEKWIRHYLQDLKVPVCIGVGGSFDVISGRLKRAPRWIQDWGFEWLYRLVQEPRRIGRNLSLLRFAFMVLKEKVGV